MSTYKTQLQDVWKDNPISREGGPFPSEQDIYNAMGQIFCPGPFYFYVFDFSKLEFLYMHPNVEDVLGISPEEATFQKMSTLIHPEDAEHMLKCERIAGSFLFGYVDQSKRKKYKITYCVRGKTKEGAYKVILHQALALNLDDNYNIMTTLGVQCDISHLVTYSNRTISFIGLDGEPSYTGIDVDQEEFSPVPQLNPAGLTTRELEVLRYLADGDTVKDISEKLILSEHTVRTHRNNLRAKLECRNTAQVVAKAIRMGII